MAERAVCTVITKSFLSHARMLAHSIAQHNPGLKLYVLLADHVDGYFDPETEDFELITLDCLADQELVQKMCFYYTPFELCCALRGLLHKYMYDEIKAERWIFLDSDIMVFGSLDRLYKQLECCSLVLSPHIRVPVEIDFCYHEINILSSGLYNGGFLALHRDDNARKFIEWFAGRLYRYGFNDLHSGSTRGLFVDQKWLDLVPLYFNGVGYLTEPGANLAHWNLYEHNLCVDQGGNISVDGEPLLFVHFSGLDLNQTGNVSIHSKMYDGLELPVWKMVADAYRDSLIMFDHGNVVSYPYAFLTFQSGEVIEAASRRGYYDGTTSVDLLWDSPFLKSNAFFCEKINDVSEYPEKVGLLSRSKRIAYNGLAEIARRARGAFSEDSR